MGIPDKFSYTRKMTKRYKIIVPVYVREIMDIKPGDRLYVTIQKKEKKKDNTLTGGY